MKLPLKIHEEINRIGFSLDLNEIGVSQKVIFVPKKRFIIIPNRYLKEEQKKLYKLLLNIPIPNYVFSQKGAFFADMARFHLNSKYLLNIDIKNFFPSIQSGRIANLFRTFGINEKVVNKITFMTTYKNSLPQGFVTSPILSNLIMLKVDSFLYKFAKYRKTKYSRYVDDISFSSNIEIKRNFVEKVIKILKSFGFSINEAKTEYFGPQDTKIILGLKLEDYDLNLTNEYLEKILAHLEELKTLTENKGDCRELRLKTLGELNFIKQINISTFQTLIKRYPI